MGWAHRDSCGLTGMGWAHRDRCGLTEMGWGHRWGRLTKMGELSGFGGRGAGTERGKGEHPRLKSTEAGCFVWPCFESSFRPTKFNKSLRKSGNLDGKYLMVVRLVFRELGLQHLRCCFRFLFVCFISDRVLGSLGCVAKEDLNSCLCLPSAGVTGMTQSFKQPPGEEQHLPAQLAFLYTPGASA